jgi:ABC-type oligopeptide transport system substrate-binding subunit
VRNRRYHICLGTFVAIALVMAAVVGCDTARPNNPYRPSESNAPIYYTTFREPPKHLDPAMAYSSNEYSLIAQIYEPPFQYHYLNRPYELEPLTVTAMPTPEYYAADGSRLGDDPSPADVDRVVYELRLKPGTMYGEHPCFARDAAREFAYHDVTDALVAGVDEVSDLPLVGSRELVAEDYILQICRLADPRLNCPIYSILENYILGMSEYRAAVQERLASERESRREAAGVGYDPVRDERDRPIAIDYLSIPFPGAQQVDTHTYRVTLTRKYPQMLFWLAMPFFSPMPQEALDFYGQGPLIRRGITLDRFPIGTGAYRMERFDPNTKIALVRNERYRDERFPSAADGTPHADTGAALPFIDRVVYVLEKESLPRWNKFLQGYYDASGVPEDSFDRAIQIEGGADAALSPFMRERDIRLDTAVATSTYYYAFNMLDSVVGGYTEDRAKLRQAIAIAVDTEENTSIFRNGRGISAHGPVPPGIFGARDGRDRMDSYVYDWDSDRAEPVRKSLDAARALLAEAGYPGGIGSDGKPLTISFDNAWTGAGARTRIRWLTKKLEAIGVVVANRTTDYRRFQDKVRGGNFQLISWGWLADYPDPENFLFLLYGPNGKAEHAGPNSSNYNSPEFNELFSQMESMPNSPLRLDIIDKATAVLQHDAPWIWGIHPVDFSLYHSWVTNTTPHLVANNTMKYRRVHTEAREERRLAWNRPRYGPVAAGFAVIAIASLPAVWTIRRRNRGA